MMKNNRPDIRKSYVVAAAVLAVFLLLILFFVLRGGEKIKETAGTTAGAKGTEESTIRLSIRWNGNDYEGNYTGDIASGKPEGEGTFSDDNGELTYIGDWKSGKFDGYGTVQYSDGTREEGMFLDGNRHHWMRTYESESHYADCLYDFGKIYGCRSEYKDGELVHETLIVNGGDHVSVIKKNAQKLTRNLIKNKGYVGEYVYISGVVDYWEESDQVCMFRIKSEEVGMVTGDYVNTAGYRSEQPMVANMKEGDKVIIYGFYTGTVRNEIAADKEYYGYQCIQIDPIYGEVETDAERGTYESIKGNPYSYCGRYMEGEYVVDRFTRSDDLTYVNVHPSGAEEENYALRIDADEDEIFYPGEKLFLRGFIVGQRIVSSRKKTIIEDDEERTITVYTKYPIIRVMSYESK